MPSTPSGTQRTGLPKFRARVGVPQGGGQGARPVEEGAGERAGSGGRVQGVQPAGQGDALVEERLQLGQEAVPVPVLGVQPWTSRLPGPDADPEAWGGTLLDNV